MKLIIAGSRDHSVDDDTITLGLHMEPWKPTEIVSGKASGIDASGEAWANRRGLPIKPFPYLKALGKAGGPVRNQQMAEYADALLAYPGPDSKGTWNMIANMKLRGKPVIVFDTNGHPIRESKWKRPNTPPAWNPGEKAPKAGKDE